MTKPTTPENKHLNYITQKTKIWVEINYLEKGYKRLQEQINQLEKDKKDMYNLVIKHLDALQKLHEENNNYE